MHSPQNPNYDRGAGHGHSPTTSHSPNSKVKAINGGPIPFAVSRATGSNGPLSSTETTRRLAAFPRDPHACATENG
jgi:hypothetical protein